MQALDIINHPENVDRKAFHIRMKLTLTTEITLCRLTSEVLHLIEYIKVQNDAVKGRGEIGVIPVMMEKVEVGADEAKSRNSSWLPLALPFTLEEAKVIMRLAKWGNVFWVGGLAISGLLLLIDRPLQEARLRDTLTIPEAHSEFQERSRSLRAPGSLVEG
ncbi:hypothetical protein EDD85DRAFT_947415 [Armillaria nabsnona]|nr:hypothetical protein EDD85DRAFT_947415 [Armillaria nabsnona]